jgi:hypothetical protein
MKMFNRKSRLQRLVETINPLASSGIKSALPGVGGKAVKVALPNGKAIKAGLPDKDQALKAGLVAGGIAGLTTGSAGISSLRRRREGARDDS